MTTNQRRPRVFRFFGRFGRWDIHGTIHQPVPALVAEAVEPNVVDGGKIVVSDWLAEADDPVGGVTLWRETC